MPSLRPLLTAALLGLCLLGPGAHAAAPPSSSEVQQNLDTLAERKLPEAEQKALKAILEQTLTLLENQADSEKRLADLKRQLAEAPGRSATPSANWPASRPPARYR